MIDQPCTTAQCDLKTGKCAFDVASEGSACDDGSLCTDKDACLLGKCKGASVACDDGNPCTNDGCEPSTGCTQKVTTAPCDDGNACTSGDGCKGGLCTGLAKDASACDDDNPCTADGCAAIGGCTHKAQDGLPCDDGEICTAVDFCAGGACQAGPYLCPCKVTQDCAKSEDGDACNGTLVCLKVAGCTATSSRTTWSSAPMATPYCSTGGLPRCEGCTSRAPPTTTTRLRRRRRTRTRRRTVPCSVHQPTWHRNKRAARPDGGGTTAVLKRTARPMTAAIVQRHHGRLG